MRRTKQKFIIPNRHKVLLPLITLVCLQAISPVYARFTRLFGAPIQPKNNTADCTPEAQKAIASTDQTIWGKVEFDCGLDGYIQSLYLPAMPPVSAHTASFYRLGSPEFKRLERFTKAYWKAFDNQPISFVDAGMPRPTIGRKRHGLTFLAGEVDIGLRQLSDGTTEYFHDFGAATKIPAGFSITPKVSRDKASITAQQEALKRGHGPVRVQKIELVIKNGCKESFKPHLAWWIQLGEKNNLKPVSCFIDADDGTICRAYPYCTSSSDAFEM